MPSERLSPGASTPEPGQWDATMPATLVSVNVGLPREFILNGRTFTSAIWKEPVAGRVRVQGVNVAGDDQADRSVHGGPDKAVYAYSQEDYAWWSAELGRELSPGTFGDNLTIRGLDLDELVVGERWEIGTVVLEACQPRLPCFKLGVRMEDPRFPSRFVQAARWGAYFRIVREGELTAGDEIRSVARPDHGVALGRIAGVYHEDHGAAAKLLAAPQLPEGWRRWVEKITATR